MRPEIIELPLPPIGGKCWLLDRKGLFVLERGPGTFRTAAVTHAGSGQFEIIDGIPDEHGFFPEENMPEPEPYTPEEYRALMDGTADDAVLARRDAMIAYGRRNGRSFHKHNPVVMGSWMLDAGFIHGLSVRVVGEHTGVNAFASLVWMPFKARK